MAIRSSESVDLSGEKQSYFSSLLPSNDEERFYVDLEFLQNLSNASYLQHLAQNGYFQREDFMNYLVYLRYWKRPEYTRFLLFPHSLAYLDALIDNVDFRNELSLPGFIEFIHKQQGAHWLKGRYHSDTDDIDSSK
jgi:mediator of RNA polymerase II transcription subunit 31